MGWELLLPVGVCAPCVRGIAFDGTQAFVRDETGIVRLEVGTGAPERIGERRASCVAAAGGRAAWAETSGPITLWRDGRAVAVARDGDRPWSVALDAERLVWASVVLVDGMTLNDRGSVRGVDLATGAVRALVEGVYQPDFVTLFRGDVIFASGERILRVGRGGLETMVETSGGINGIALAEASCPVWLDEGGDGSVCALSDERGVEVLARCEDQPVEIAAAAGHVVWVESSGDDPHRAFELRLGDPRRTPIAPPGDDPGYAIATDGRTVLWAMSDGSIWRR